MSLRTKALLTRPALADGWIRSSVTFWR